MHSVVRIQPRTRGPSVRRPGRTAVSVAVVLSMLCAGTALPFPRTLYCSPSGSDAGTGAPNRPFRSPGFASRLLSPGDTLVLLAGTYVLSRFDSDILSPPDGRPGAWITVRGAPAGRPVLAGRDNLLCAFFLSSYLRVENVEITSDGGAFFRDGLNGTDRPLRGIVLSGLFVHRIDGMALDVRDVDSLTVEDCDFSYCGFGGIGGPEASAGGLRRVRVEGCALSYSGHYYQGVTSAGAAPGNPYDRPDGFGIEPSEGPVEIVRTVAEHNRGDGLDSKAANTTVSACRVENNFANGVKLWAGGSRIENTLIAGTGDGDPASEWANVVIECGNRGAGGFDIVHCTVADHPSRRSYAMHVQYDSPAEPVRVAVRNSVFSGSYGSVFFGDSVRLDCSYCLFDRPFGDVPVEARGRGFTSAEIEAGHLGPGNRVGDPLFKRPEWGATGDYRLGPGSPAVDAGTAVPVASDLDGRPRPLGAGFDMGCYESSGPSAVRRGPSSGTFRHPFQAGYPNPTNGRSRIRIDLPASSEVFLTLFDATGRRVFRRSFGLRPAGPSWFEVDLTGLAGGVYVGLWEAGRSRFRSRWAVEN
jgi:hypothetical protein